MITGTIATEVSQVATKFLLSQTPQETLYRFSGQLTHG